MRVRVNSVSFYRRWEIPFGIWFGIFFLISAVLLILGGIWERDQQNKFATEGIETSATVAEIDYDSGSVATRPRYERWIVTFNFTTAEGQSVFGTKTYTSNANLPKVGDVVEIVYLSSDPRKVRLKEEVQDPPNVDNYTMWSIGLFILSALSFTFWVVQRLLRNLQLDTKAV